ncbi:Metallo-dependent phosphatase-like protein [Mycena floridula]|nr:Metallo-dependent phosphatase-like protein [Mycena floridula]
MILSPVLLAAALPSLVVGSPLVPQNALRRAGTLDPYPNKPRLSFKSDGTFKITVFSDLHYGENPWDSWGPEQDFNSTRLMNTVLPDEKPDFVVLNGDLITGENTFRENSTSLIDEIVAPLNRLRIPFSSSHGNHDNQANITHLEEIEREQKVAPLSYTRAAPPGIGGQFGPGNYWVPIHASQDSSRPALILWFFDSRGGVTPGINSTTKVPDWVDSSVAGWIASETAAMEKAWGPAETRGALAFVHIPPLPVQALQATLDSDKEPGLNADLLEGDGSVQGTYSPGNEGKDTPFWNAVNKYIKNLHAVISGHDHGNEWCARDPAKDVIFCFGKHSGYGGYGTDGWGFGVRNLVFSTPNPACGVRTWIRLEDGSTRAEITLDEMYKR